MPNRSESSEIFHRGVAHGRFPLEALSENQWPHDGPQRARMRGIATKPYLDDTARSENEADVPFAAHREAATQNRLICVVARAGGVIKTRSAPSLLASESILC